MIEVTFYDGNMPVTIFLSQIISIDCGGKNDTRRIWLTDGTHYSVIDTYNEIIDKIKSKNMLTS